MEPFKIIVIYDLITHRGVILIRTFYSSVNKNLWFYLLFSSVSAQRVDSKVGTIMSIFSTLNLDKHRFIHNEEKYFTIRVLNNLKEKIWENQSVIYIYNKLNSKGKYTTLQLYLRKEQIFKYDFDYISLNPDIRTMIRLLRVWNNFITRRHNFWHVFASS